MDVSGDEQRVYVCGVSLINGLAGGAIVIAANFDQHLGQISGKLLDDMDYGTPRRLKRLKGQEILILGCDLHFAILQFQGSSLVQIGALRNIHEGAVTDFVVRGPFLYSKAYGEPDIAVTKIGALGPPSGGPMSPRSPTSPRSPSSPRISNLSTNSNPPIFGGVSTMPQSQYQSPTRSRIAADFAEPLEKVAVSQDGQRMYTGGRGMHILERRGQEFFPLKIDNQRSNLFFKKVHNFFGIKTTRSRHVIIQEPTSNDFIVLDANGGEVTRHRGIQKCTFGKILRLSSRDSYKKPTLFK